MILEISGDRNRFRIREVAAGEWHLDWFGPSDVAPPTGEHGFQRLPASPDRPVGPCLLPRHGAGFHGISQVDAFRSDDRRRIDWAHMTADKTGETLILSAEDETTGCAIRHELSFAGDVLVVESRVQNRGEHPLDILRAATVLLPTPDWAQEVITHTGAWGREGHINRRTWTGGRVEQVGRGGRPGFDGGPGLVICESSTNENQGRAMACHLAWSGSFRLAVERSVDGSAQILAERDLAPGEIRLQPGEMMSLPRAVLAVTAAGFSSLSNDLHSYARSQSRPVRRKVHFNTWEARYFEVSDAACRELAQSAAPLGAERFILDDGWFNGRRDDTTSLGDWYVDENQFPAGLGPLIETVHGEGMSFGLWVEPEMVSPDSDLFRRHPDWVLGHPREDLPTGRNQLVLDLSLSEVSDYLFERISALLDEYAIDYLKWDCNRDLYPARRDGVERGGAQTEALYALLGRLHERFPEIEIESCASGGGRIDLGILPHITRFWTSDATDAIDRIRIQRAASMLMPPELLGAHVGPAPNPMTGRSLPMSFRVAVAFFGHLGIEADPERLSADERAVLARGIEAYKQHRDWMGRARLWRLSEAGEDPDAQLLVSEDGARAALRIARVSTPERPLTARIRLAGLDPDANYAMTELALQGEPAEWPLGDYSGRALMQTGENLDPGRAETARLIFLERIPS